MKKSLIFSSFLFLSALSSLSFAGTASASSFSLNLGTGETDKPSVLIYFIAPKDTAFMRISNNADFAVSQKVEYAPALLWNICTGLSSCLYGSHTVYARLTPRSGSEETISSSINYVIPSPSAPQAVAPVKTPSGISSSTFPRILQVGSVGPDVRVLQVYLNNHGFLISSTGPGSRGFETDYFGLKTKIALKAFQEAHRAEILTPGGFVSGTGMLGPATVAFIVSHP